MIPDTVRTDPSLPALRLFLAVAAVSSFSRAARDMNISQPALTPVLEEKFGLVCRADDPLAECQALGWDVFAERPFIAMAPLSSVRRATDMTFARLGRTVEPLFECAHIPTVGGLVANGLGLTALPQSAAPLLASDNLTWRPLEQPLVNRTVGLARLRHFSLSSAAEAFAQTALAFAKDET